MQEGFLILYHPDCNRRLWSFTKSADLPLKTEALAGSPVKCLNTAGGDFHPALRTRFKKIIDCKKNSAKKIHKDLESSKHCSIIHSILVCIVNMPPKKALPLLYIATSFFFSPMLENFLQALSLYFFIKKNFPYQ